MQGSNTLENKESRSEISGERTADIILLNQPFRVISDQPNCWPGRDLDREFRNAISEWHGTQKLRSTRLTPHEALHGQLCYFLYHPSEFCIFPGIPSTNSAFNLAHPSKRFLSFDTHRPEYAAFSWCKT
jgi:hypothetical protein